MQTDVDSLERWDARGSSAGPIALAFADASVVVLALPQIVIRLHTSISHVTWVITAYNIALIALTLVIVPFANRLASRAALVSGTRDLRTGVAGLRGGRRPDLLLVFRGIQGAGAALLCVPRCRFSPAAATRSAPWAATAAFGAGLGPADRRDPDAAVRLARDLLRTGAGRRSSGVDG